MVVVIPGFSLTNRLLLYASLLLTPAQAESGVGSNCPSNIGFLAYNWYTQYAWYVAIKHKQLHALSLLPVHFNLIYAITYLGGITSGNICMGAILGFGTAGLLIFNTVAAWTSWATNLPEGYGVYKFFFFGWRTLTPGWRTFILLWQITDTLGAITSAFLSISIAMSIEDDDDLEDAPQWWNLCLSIILGPPLMLFWTWPLILWTELIIARNHIESQTDNVAVWLFVAQAVAMLLPIPCSMEYVFDAFQGSISNCVAILKGLFSVSRESTSSGTIPMENLGNG
jgi:hypothetical protein